MLIVFTSCQNNPNSNLTYDVVIYGGTSAGVVAAVEVARLGKTVVIIESSSHLGGLSSGGLGATDIGNKEAIGGLSRDFYKLVNQHYNPQSNPNETMWTFEPHVAEQIFNTMLKEYEVPVIFGERLDLNNGVLKEAGKIVEINMESGLKIKGSMFIDATYEGDLMAVSGVNFAVGRESNKIYGETYNGVQSARSIYHQFKKPVDPYKSIGNPESGLLPGILDDGGPGIDGDGDHRIQAYCFRMCLTNTPENRIPFPKPKGYDALRYELLLRYINTGNFDVLNLSTAMPNGKTDTNNKGAFGTDNIGMNYDYPNGNYATREKIIKEHELYQKGLMWFLSNDQRVPETIRKEVGQWGLPKDEFMDNKGWPHQLYIREARRMISEYIMTQHDCEGLVTAMDPIGLAAYTMDSHNVQRYVDQFGNARNEGNVEIGGFSPYPISYKSIVPKKEECTNLLVPVCLSSSHIAFGSIRMEPVFMVLAQSAAAAAVQALNRNSSVQEIDYDMLRDQLNREGQVLAWKNNKGLAVQKRVELIDDKNELIKTKLIKDVSAISYPGNFLEFDGKLEEISYQFTVDESFGYELNIHKIMNSDYGNSELWLDQHQIGNLEFFKDVQSSAPSLQTFEINQLTKGSHKLTFKFESPKKIGIEKIFLTRMPNKIQNFLISQSFAGFMGEKGRDMYPVNKKNIKWSKAKVIDDGVVHLDKLLSPNESCHAFAKTQIICDESIETNLLIGHNDGAFIWLNGQLIYDSPSDNSFKYNQFTVPLKFNKGKNELMLMILQGGGSWLFNVNLDSNQFKNKLPA